MNILSRVEAHVRSRPDKPFSIMLNGGRRETMTYGQLWTGAEAYARLFAERRLPKDGLILIMVRDPRTIYRAFVGAMLYGAVPSIMPYCTPKQDPVLFWSSHISLFERIRPCALIAFRGYRDAVARAAGSATLLFDDEMPVDIAAMAPAMTPPDTAIAFLQHSSGTTGLKKGVMLAHDAVLAQIDAYAPTVRLDAGSVVATWLPLYHDMGLIACFVAPMMMGATIIQLDSIEWVGAPLTLLDAIDAWKATHVWLPNFAFNHLALNRRGSRRWDLSSLRAVVNCSEPCKIASMRQFVDTFADCGLAPMALQVSYAMAETVFAITQTPLDCEVSALPVSRSSLAAQGVVAEARDDGDIQWITSCGPPVPGMKLRIVDDNTSPVQKGVVGEIAVSGTSLYSGYNRMPELTARKLRDGWHLTGDLGFQLNGNLYVTGRKDDLLIVRGRNFYAHEIEDSMSKTDGTHPGRVVAFSIDNEAAGTAEVVCLVEARSDADPTVLRRELRSNIERDVGVTVSRIELVASGSLVKTTSGKISREINRARYLERASMIGHL